MAGWPLSRSQAVRGVLVLAAALAAGCGATRTKRLSFKGAPDASYDYYFFVGIPEPDDRSRAELRDQARVEIERLAHPGWRMARENLFRLGPAAIDELIRNLDRTEDTVASVRPYPGPVLAEGRDTWPLGYVAYAVLLDFVNNYTSYWGTDLPGHDKAAWRTWWARNDGIQVYSAERTAPGYVLGQLAEARATLVSRYDTRARRKTKKPEKVRGKPEKKRRKAERKISAAKRLKIAPEPAVEKAREPRRKPREEARRGGRGERRPSRPPERPAPVERPPVEEPVEEAAPAEGVEEAKEVEEEVKEPEVKAVEEEEEKPEEKPKEEKKPSRRRRRRRR